jgi:hypothetical protein
VNYIENLKAAIAAVEAQPELDLNQYRKVTDCGTLYCVAGLLPTIPHFAALGVVGYIGGVGAPELPDSRSSDDTLDELFGMFPDGDAYNCLCALRKYGEWDEELLASGRLTDKELALARLNKALAIRLQENT